MSTWIWLVVVWIIGSVLGVGIGRWNGQKALDREYDTGYDEGYAAARAEYDARLDRADQIVLRTQELDVPRPNGPDPAVRGVGTGSLPSAGRDADPVTAGPGHTIYPELTPQALEAGDAGFQPSGWSATYADLTDLTPDRWAKRGEAFIEDQFDALRRDSIRVEDWLAGQRALTAGWLTPRMLERAA